MGFDPPGAVEEVPPEPGIGSAEVLQQAPDRFPRGKASAVSLAPMTSLSVAYALIVIFIARSFPFPAESSPLASPALPRDKSGLTPIRCQMRLLHFPFERW